MIMLMCASGLSLGSCDSRNEGNTEDVEIETRPGTASDHGAGTEPGTGATTIGNYDGNSDSAPYTDSLVSDPEEVKGVRPNTTGTTQTRSSGNGSGNGDRK